MEQNIEKKIAQLKKVFLRIEIVIGFLSMICGTILTIMVWFEGYFAGALMLVVTGFINIFLAIKELIDPTDKIFHWQAMFFMIVRRAMFFLNTVLLALVIGTITNLL